MITCTYDMQGASVSNAVAIIDKMIIYRDKPSGETVEVVAHISVYSSSAGMVAGKAPIDKVVYTWGLQTGVTGNYRDLDDITASGDKDSFTSVEVVKEIEDDLVLDDRFKTSGSRSAD